MRNGEKIAPEASATQLPDSIDDGLPMVGDDDDIKAFFRSFDQVGASDELKSATLARMLDQLESEGAGGAETQQDQANRTPVGEGRTDRALTERTQAVQAPAGQHLAARTQAAQTRVEQSPPAPERAAAESFDATPGRMRHMRRSKWRVIRIVAIAACLVLALTGGVAYAVPTTHVTLRQGSDSVVIDVNCFGIALSANADASGDGYATDFSDVMNRPYDEALPLVIDRLAKDAPEEPIEVSVDARDEAHRVRMEGEASQMIADRAPGAAAAEGTQEATAPAGPGQAPDEQGQPDQTDQPAPGAQPEQGGQANPSEPPAQSERDGQAASPVAGAPSNQPGQSGDPGQSGSPGGSGRPE